MLVSHKAPGPKPTFITPQQYLELRKASYPFVQLIKADPSKYSLLEISSIITWHLQKCGESQEMWCKFEYHSEHAEELRLFRSKTQQQQVDFVCWIIGRWDAARGIYNTTFLTLIWDCLERYEELEEEMIASRTG
jgi:hypothetical protein